MGSGCVSCVGFAEYCTVGEVCIITISYLEDALHADQKKALSDFYFELCCEHTYNYMTICCCCISYKYNCFNSFNYFFF